MFLFGLKKRSLGYSLAVEFIYMYIYISSISTHCLQVYTSNGNSEHWFESYLSKGIFDFLRKQVQPVFISVVNRFYIFSFSNF